MQLKDIFYGLADFIEWTFGILPMLGNIPNLVFLIIGSICFLYWMNQMVKHKRVDEA